MGYKRATRTMAIIVENIIRKQDENYERYGTVIVTVRNTETNEIATASADWDLFCHEAEATAKAIKKASDQVK